MDSSQKHLSLSLHDISRATRSPSPNIPREAWAPRLWSRRASHSFGQSLRSRTSSRTSSSTSTGLESAAGQMYIGNKGSRSSVTGSLIGEREIASPTSTTSSGMSIRGETNSAGGSTGRGRFITVMPQESRSRSCHPRGDNAVSSTRAETASQKDEGKNDDKQSVLVRQKTDPSIVINPSVYNFLNEIVWQIDSTVFCGGYDAYANQTLLCRLNVEYLVDLSGSDDDDMPRRGDCPCLCPRRTRHSRMIMTLRVSEEEEPLQVKINIIELFEEFMNMVRKAKALNKSLLIYSMKGRNRAPAFAAAYLMHNLHISRMVALSNIKNIMHTKRPGVQITAYLQRALMRWQAHLGILSTEQEDESKLIPMFSVKRTAWT